jgi:transposase
LRGETSIAALCRREGIRSNLYYRWGKKSRKAGKQRLVGDAERQADSRQVSEMRAELSLKNRVLTPALAGGARERSLLGKEPAWNK